MISERACSGANRECVARMVRRCTIHGIEVQHNLVDTNGVIRHEVGELVQHRRDRNGGEARDFDPRGDAANLLQEIGGHEARVVARTAGGDVHRFDSFENIRGGGAERSLQNGALEGVCALSRETDVDGRRVGRPIRDAQSGGGYDRNRGDVGGLTIS